MVVNQIVTENGRKVAPFVNNLSTAETNYTSTFAARTIGCAQASPLGCFLRPSSNPSNAAGVHTMPMQIRRTMTTATVESPAIRTFPKAMKKTKSKTTTPSNGTPTPIPSPASLFYRHVFDPGGHVRHGLRANMLLGQRCCRSSGRNNRVFKEDKFRNSHHPRHRIPRDTTSTGALHWIRKIRHQVQCLVKWTGYVNVEWSGI